MTALDSHPPRPSRGRSLLDAGIRLLLSGLSGLLLFASFQPLGWWFAAPLGIALFFCLLDPQRPRLALPLAWVQGLVLYLALLPWVGEFVGAIAWIALAIVQSLYSALWGAGLVALLRRRPPRSALFLAAAVLWWAATEWLRSSWPFGGFPWGRVAWGQISGPLIAWISIGGPALVSVLVVLLGGGLAAVLLRLRSRQLPRLTLARVGAALGGLVLLLAPSVLSATGHPIARPAPQQAQLADSPLLVAAIQGNVPRLGLDFNEQRRAVLDNHARVTTSLASQVDRGALPRPDLVIWPENASDVNPLVNPDAAEVITTAQQAIGAPLLLGTVTPHHNVVLAWDEDGAGERHVKKYLQPFGEYMPFRDLLRRISPYVDRAGNFQPGDDNGVVTVNTAAGAVAVGVSTCYEVAFDGSPRDAVRGGAALLTVPTNNATFGFTSMTYQQLAMSRARALEYDRSVVVAATSGVSALITPDGSVVQQSEIFEAAALVASVPTRATLTLSALWGPWPQRILGLLGTLCVLGAMIVNRRSRARDGD